MLLIKGSPSLNQCACMLLLREGAKPNPNTTYRQFLNGLLRMHHRSFYHLLPWILRMHQLLIFPLAASHFSWGQLTVQLCGAPPTNTTSSSLNLRGEKNKAHKRKGIHKKLSRWKHKKKKSAEQTQPLDTWSRGMNCSS